MECPVCGEALEGGAAGAAHVNAHFGDEVEPPCALCGARVASAEAASHAAVHALQAADFAEALRAGGGSAADAIDLCGEGDVPDGRPQRLRAPPRPRVALSALPGASRAEAAAAEAGGLHALLRGALLAQPAHRGLFRAALAGAPLLHYATADGLDAGCAPSLFLSLFAAKTRRSGPHTPSRSLLLTASAPAHARSWGCGYRNMQMLCAHLQGLAGDPRGAALFGGGGAVPDVPSLQAWLEAAWAGGFDAEGCAQLGGVLQEGRAWVGATDCAALLRSFGLRARVVDFRVADGHAQPTTRQQQQPKRPRDEGDEATAVHPGVEVRLLNYTLLCFI